MIIYVCWMGHEDARRMAFPRAPPTNVVLPHRLNLENVDWGASWAAGNKQKTITIKVTYRVSQCYPVL